MKSWGGVGVVAGMVWLGAGLACGQEASPAAAASQTETTTPAAKVYEVGADVVAPELIPMQWEVIAPDACKEPKEGLVSLAFVVDAVGAPQHVSVVSPQGTTLEKMALRIVGADRFKPGTLKGEPVDVRLREEVTIKGCSVAKTDEAGNARDVFRLIAQPLQEFVATARQKESAEIASAIAAVPLEPGVYRIGHGVSAPVALNSVDAGYSYEARVKRVQGVCLISMIVDAQGKPQNPRVIRPLGYGLDEKAIKAVNKYKFKPAMKEGVAVPVRITVEVNFRLYERPN